MTFLGIDVSKRTFDAALLWASEPKKMQHQVFQQSPRGYADFMHWLTDQAPVSDVLICLEHTGFYITGGAEHLCAQGLAVWVEMPLRIKRSMGLQRGGDDKAAAIAIAQYAYRFHDQCRLWQPADALVEQLRHLAALRGRLVESQAKLTVPLQELADCGAGEESRQLAKLQAPVLRGLMKSIAQVETSINDLITAHQPVQAVINQVTSIKGIGKQTAINLYVYTRGFTVFAKAKSLACYCGVAPFEKSSGTSVRYKPGVSPYANRKLKKLLHMCALAALRWNADLKQYYERKVAEGKNKMSVINAVRNKLIHRIFAVVRDGRHYVGNPGAVCG